MAERFDAIIVGGSFAGLSVAYRLRGKVLMVTKHPPGAFQTSACCTYLPVLERLGCEDSILQTIDTFVVHFPGRRITFRLRTPFCTFDYRRFCQALADRLCAEVLIASAQSYDGGILTTTAGKFRTACLIVVPAGRPPWPAGGPLAWSGRIG
jgi:flavin-dependent dehydrogenase